MTWKIKQIFGIKFLVGYEGQKALVASWGQRVLQPSTSQEFQSLKLRVGVSHPLKRNKEIIISYYVDDAGKRAGIRLSKDKKAIYFLFPSWLASRK